MRAFTALLQWRQLAWGHVPCMFQALSMHSQHTPWQQLFCRHGCPKFPWRDPGLGSRRLPVGIPGDGSQRLPVEPPGQHAVEIQRECCSVFLHAHAWLKRLLAPFAVAPQDRPARAILTAKGEALTRRCKFEQSEVDWTSCCFFQSHVASLIDQSLTFVALALEVRASEVRR